jgi:hypothetical protein
MGKQSVTPLEYRLKANELRRDAHSFESAAAKRRARIIADHLEWLAALAVSAGIHFDDLD